MHNQIIHSDALTALRQLPIASVDAILTDPPAGIAFLNKDWDKNKGGRDAWVTWLQVIFVEALRVFKPGGHVLVWSLPRTSHWTAYALDNAGFEIRDCVYHLFGEGMPKGQNIGKAIAGWQGWGTTLKPAVECWWLARAPVVEKTIATNVLAYGTGAINIDACRIAGEDLRAR